MTWLNFQEDAFNITKREAKRLTRQVLNQYDLAIKSISEQLTPIYRDMLAGVEPVNYYDTMIKRDRLEDLLKQIKLDYSRYSRAAGNLTTQLINLTFSNTYYRKAFASQWLIPQLAMSPLPTSLIELTVLGTNQAWKNVTESIQKKFGEKILYKPQKGTLSSLLANDKRKQLDRIQAALTQKFSQGATYTETIKSIRNIIGTRTVTKDGKIKYTGSKADAMRIIRTEGNRTMNMGSYANDKYIDSQGFDIVRLLVSTLDSATRPQSAQMDGQKRAVDKPFNYPGGVTAMTPGTTGVEGFDINDRETVATLVDGFEPEIRRGRNPVTGENEVFSYKQFPEWAKENGLKKNKYGAYYDPK